MVETNTRSQLRERESKETMYFQDWIHLIGFQTIIAMICSSDTLGSPGIEGQRAQVIPCTHCSVLILVSTPLILCIYNSKREREGVNQSLVPLSSALIPSPFAVGIL